MLPRDIADSVNMWMSGLTTLSVIALLYLTPTVVAFARGHRNRWAITALNVLTGWTFVGWVVSIVWAIAQ